MLQHQVTPTSATVSRQGIQWGVAEIRDIFSFLANFADMVNIAGPPAEPAQEWFYEDVKNLPPTTEIEDIRSWYAKFSAVASSIVINFIALHFGYQGKRYMYNSELVCKDILMRIPTPPWPNGEYTPFPTLKVSLEQWAAEMGVTTGNATTGNFGEDEAYNSTMTENWLKKVNNIHDGISPADQAAIVDASEKGDAVAAMFAEAEAEDSAKLGFDPETDEMEFPDPAIFGMVPVKPRTWTPFLESFAGAN
jgi:hypothetical protein